jgi:hypothetical protein
MADTLATLERRLDKVVRNLDRGLTDVVVAVAVAIAEGLVPATPVDTGFARGNWRPALNSPALVPITFLDKSGAATVEKIGAVAARWRPGDTLFISNVIDYILALNAGSSPQADAGFVQDAVNAGTAKAFGSFRGGVISAGRRGGL